MPYQSEAQRRYFNANKKKLESSGVDVDEWNKSSKGKKLPEYASEKQASTALNLLHLQASRLLTKLAAEEDDDDEDNNDSKSKSPNKKPSKAKDILDMDSTGGRLADYLAPLSWGGERAGRARAMADAIGEKTTFGVRHPFMQTMGHTLGGGILGSAAGGLAGAGLGFGDEWLRKSQGEGHPLAMAKDLGTVGGVVGGLAGLYNSGKNRRNEMKRLSHFYDQDAAEGKVNPKNPKLSTLSALLFPARGSHRTGQVEAVKAMQGKKKIPQQHGLGRDALYTAGIVPPIGLAHNYAQNFKTQFGNDDEGFRRRPAKKAASYVSELAKFAADQAFAAEFGGYKKKSHVKTANMFAGMDPTLRNALIGAGGGSLLGAGSGALSGFMSPEEKIKTTPDGRTKKVRKGRLASAAKQGLKGLLPGAAAGGLAGGGLTEFARWLPNATIPLDIEKYKANVKQTGNKNIDRFQRELLDSAGDSALNLFKGLDRKDQFDLIGTPIHPYSHPTAKRVFGNW
jgi:hypothetical protein